MATTTTAGSLPKLLVLGFYHRGNLGDDLYEHALGRILAPAYELQFVCMDDVCAVVSRDYAAVVCGGGDIVNPYFIERLRSWRAARPVPCPVLAVSVGVAYDEDAERYLADFDHVFARSRECEAKAVRVLGRANVTYMPDAVFCLHAPGELHAAGAAEGSLLGAAWARPHSLGIAKAAAAMTEELRLGVCLAQPCFARRATRSALLMGIAEATVAACVKAGASRVAIILFAFNTGRNPQENDTAVLEDFAFAVSDAARNDAPGLALRTQVEAVVAGGPLFPTGACQVDAFVCMRYHALVLALASGAAPAFALYCTPKVGRLVADMGLERCSYRMPTDGEGRPLPVASGALSDGLAAFLATRHPVGMAPEAIAAARSRLASACDELRAVLASGKRRLLPPPQPAAASGTGREEAEEAEAGARCLALARALASEGPEEAARAVCYVATGGSLATPYQWGLQEKLQADPRALHDDAWLLEQFRYIRRSDLAARAGQPAALASSRRTYHLPAIHARLDVDGLGASMRDFQGVHRAGWAFAMSGLVEALGAPSPAAAELLLDSYMDRTYHWGRAVLTHSGVLPLRKRWVGFLHHTFDETHSCHNCVRMLACTQFRESLATCACIITLSAHLARALQAALREESLPEVRVRTVTHPTGLPDDDPALKQFRLDAFWKSRPRRVIQVGAWLRRPYAIYELPLTTVYRAYTGCTAQEADAAFRKCALRGVDMTSYFPPPAYEGRLMAWADGSGGGPAEDGGPGGGVCRSAAPGMCRGPGSAAPGMCRDEAPRPSSNRFVCGAAEHLIKQARDVCIVERLSDADYDVLLSESVVFADLVDAAAVNTVLECIARSTPILINRLPALEEYLGEAYPGFYTDYTHAASMATSREHLAVVHDYLRALPKARFSLDRFVSDVNAILKESV